MALVDKNSVDLYFTEDGDFVIDEELQDMKNTKEEKYRVIEQSLFMRMENNLEDFGMRDSGIPVDRNSLRIMFGLSENVFANLDDFHGEKLNENTLALIKSSVSNCLNSDSLLSTIPHVISVIKKNDTTVSILIALKIIERLPDGTINDAVITYNGMYNTYSKDFRMYSFKGTKR